MEMYRSTLRSMLTQTCGFIFDSIRFRLPAIAGTAPLSGSGIFAALCHNSLWLFTLYAQGTAVVDEEYGYASLNEGDTF